MGFQDDWIMRQVEIITRYVVKLVFGRDDTEYTMELADGISFTDEIHLEIDIVVQVVQNRLRRGRQGIAFFARQVEAGKQERTNHIDQHYNRHRHQKSDDLILFQILAFVLHPLPPYHLRLDRTNFVALRNSAITLRKYNTSRVSMTPRLSEL